MEETKSTNFIEEIINDNLANGDCDEIITRFPPEPNGYLHIGHAKSLCINFGMKEKYHGKCNLRYDDTNPCKEDVEYVNSIKEDIKWLGFEWDNELYASDYFDRMYECAVELIKKGLAYVCDYSAEQIRLTRGTLTEPGQNSPSRDRSVEENLKLFEEMKEGKYADGEKVLRAKIDMASPNINMRDPVIYRILRATHHRTGDKWCIYPMYDFAHPLEDAFEGITHSICTLEFEDHRPLYDWVKYNCGFGKFPQQIEFARLGMTRTIMSKRYLKKLVDEGKVSGWSDPRMPTLSGMRERGYPAPAIRNFCEAIGVSKSNSEVDVAMLEHFVRDYLNTNADRRMVVKDPIKLIVANAEQDEVYDIEDNPNAEVPTTHKVTFSRELYIDREDFAVNPPPKYKRLVVGGKVRLKGSYILEYVSHKCDADGKVTEVVCNYIPDSISGGVNAGIKVKGVIQWVNAKDCIDVVLHEFDYLLLDGEGDFNDRLTPDSHKVYANVKGEAELANCKAYDRFQFMRMGYFSAVKDYGKDGKYEFNMITGLKDSFKQ
ncbi:MAG: glutamine--tRNA ligase/YqeY domain fusion protein [Clostridia bacterium]|nr:glutamine--tRNA ligase/YqeY domain fusion protein [Clostridia bacterium]MDY4082975.1 glutamine--tRNA ligase/YqeY domain fusion protein [Eubacteriales bacterium]